MKHLLKYILLVFILVSCQDDLEKEFNNPEKHAPSANDVPAGLFAEALYRNKIFVQDYGEWYYVLSGKSVSAYSQIGMRPLISAYESSYKQFDDVVTGNGFTDASGVSEYFYDMYDRLKAYKLIGDYINKGDEQLKKDNQIYYILITFIKDYCMVRNVDFFNSIPYSEAFKGENNFFPKYDDPKEIYIAALNNFKSTANDLPGIFEKMSGPAKDKFRKQDVAFHGDINKWVQYANALRLRYAVRISGVDEALAKTHIQEAIQNLPNVDLVWDLPFKPLDDLTETNTGGGTWTRGFADRYTSFFIPNIIMKRMNHGTLAYEEGIDDPRLPVLSMPTMFQDYRGIPMDQSVYAREYDSIVNQPASNRPAGMSDTDWDLKKRFIVNNSRKLSRHLAVNRVSSYNYLTFMYNNPPVYMTSLAEIDLYLAEVAAKSLASTGKTAGDHVKDAVTHSTDYWYTINGRSEWLENDRELDVLRPAKPASGIIDGYANTVKSLYESQSGIENQMEIIMQQKYIHMNVTGTYELWAELRRTRHPKLEPVSFGAIVKTKPIVERAKYHKNEQVYNADNFSKVQSHDNYTTPIFWVPENKKTESYYMDNYLP